MLKSAFDQESVTKEMDIEQFRVFCGRYAGNLIVKFAEDIGKTLINADGKVTLAALEALSTALKYSKPVIKGNSEQNTGLLAPPTNSKPFERLAFRLTQRYSSLPVAFRRFDRDQDGVISYADFTESVQELNLDLTTPEIQDIFLQLGGQTTLAYHHFAKIKGDPMFPLLEKEPKVREIREQTGQSSESPSRLYFGPGRRSPHSSLPSHINPEHTYGLKTPFSEDISHLLSNSFEQEYLEKLRKRQELYMRREKTQSRAPTNSERLRNAAIRRKLDGNREKRQWKMPKFERKEEVRREQKALERSQNSHL